MSSEYSKNKIAWVGSTPIFAFLLLLIAILYTNEGFDKVITIFIFCILTMIILIPFLLIPIVNIAMSFYILDDMYRMLINAVGIEGDQFTAFFVWFVHIIYITINYILVITTISSVAYFIEHDMTRLGKICNKCSLIKPKQ